jgi:hypothetical protein
LYQYLNTSQKLILQMSSKKQKMMQPSLGVGLDGELTMGPPVWDGFVHRTVPVVAHNRFPPKTALPVYGPFFPELVVSGSAMEAEPDDDQVVSDGAVKAEPDAVKVVSGGAVKAEPDADKEILDGAGSSAGAGSSTGAGSSAEHGAQHNEKPPQSPKTTVKRERSEGSPPDQWSDGTKVRPFRLYSPHSVKYYFEFFH